mmetsp:Transcript_33685/g.60819  ORF Transcript_33685/g.60819 Transcript_33685/m.60819 type:complete len:186 (-) Transcript_33685:394-951(-)|eukprot:CAMPEP_0175055334 /NCGR_PEP_ID=MMETSP0052_2-20121109/10019_1 /TAXON_ID=51329 ORGANISM="Polytomella parva, Strain SAG 63-3" /NCGR_SAMPLE_ID=MMETSP0052_2 /ASSEMBLY_ACC=CAM_ASM_000194 /LENGTH=185 /DNA_ID=CAMNT_0016320161 /DNA_START=75 /DNA_END=632 /DNA_ORIENTATION=+
MACGCIADVAKRIIVTILSFLKLAFAIAIIVIVAKKLSGDLSPIEVIQHNDSTSCYLGANVKGHNLCAYAYAVCGASIVATFIISLFLCITCEFCGLGSIIELLFAGLGTAWWVAASIVFTKYGKTANNDNWPYKDARNTVIVLSWLEAVFFGIIVLYGVLKALCSICSCCCGGASEKDKGHARA